MTQREIIFADVDDQPAVREVVNSLKRATPASQYFEPLEKISLKILKEAGITPQSDERNSGWTAVVKSQGYAEDSPEGYAARTLEQTRCIRVALKAGDAVVASQFGFELGLLAKEAAMKFEFEPTWETGLKIKTAARRGGPKPGSKNDRDRELAEKFLERQGKSGKSDSKIKADLGKVEGLSRSAAIDAVNRGLKLLSG